MPQKFPYITDGIYGQPPINFYAAADSEKGVVLYPSPGLLTFCTLTNCTEIRALYEWNNYLYVVAKRGSQSPVYVVDSNGNFSEIGVITTSSTGKVWIENNILQLTFFDGVWGYVYTPASGSFIPIADADFPGAGGVAYQDGRGLFWFVNSTTWGFSDPLDFLSYDATHRYVMRANNDKIRGMVSVNEQVWILGDTTAEIWYNYGGDDTSAENPTYARYKDGVKEVGIGAAATLTDTEGAGPSWVSNKREFILAVGTSPIVVTNQMFSRAIDSFALYSDAHAFSYTDKGHKFVQINFPTGDQTWVFDGTTKLFHKKQSRKTDKTFGRHRANCYAYFNGKHYVGDYENGKVYEMSQDYYDDAGQPIRRELYTTPVDYGIHDRRHSPLQIIVDPGVGLKTNADPYIMMEYTNDRRTEGQVWSNEIWRSAGKIGEGHRKAMWWRLGSSSFRMYHFAFTDPVLWQVLEIDTGDQQSAVS